MCLYPKCSILNGEFKSFISPHHFGLEVSTKGAPRRSGLYSHILSLLWGPHGLYNHIDFAPITGTPMSQGLCSHIDFSPVWRPREGRVYVDVFISPRHGVPE